MTPVPLPLPPVATSARQPSLRELASLVRRVAEEAPGVHHVVTNATAARSAAAQIGKRPLPRGVIVRPRDGRLRVELRLYLVAGCEVHETVAAVQEAVRREVHRATALSVQTVTVRVLGFRRPH